MTSSAPVATSTLSLVVDAENGMHLRLLSGIDRVADVRAAAASDGFSPVLIALASAFAHAKYLLLAVSAAGIVVAAFQRLRDLW